MPIFRGTLGETLGDDPDHLAGELLATVGGITVDTLTDPDRYPPPRQLALPRRALARLDLSAERPAS
jgi:hypothetical protein